jgi:sulfur relay (sulfurtransferase) DsrC/TusE family protein
MSTAKDQTPSFAGFGEDFQNIAIQALLIDHAWAEQMFEIIKPEYFELAWQQYLVKRFYDYYTHYRTFPSLAIMVTVVRQDVDENNKHLMTIIHKVINFFDKVKKDPDMKDLPFVKDRVLDFCKRQAMQEALMQSADLLSKGQEENYMQVVEIMKNALTAGDEVSVGHDFDEDREARFVETKRDPIPIGIPDLDSKEVLDGGIGRGELAVFVAAPGVGKSHWLAERGAYPLKQGYNVLHYTLEMGEAQVGHRYDAWFTGVNNRHIPSHREEIVRFYEEYGDRIGRLIIKEYPSKYATTMTFRAHLQKLLLKKNFWPDIVIVDYADEMCAIQKFDSASSRHEYKAILRDLRNLARESKPKFAVWTASQSNKEGSSSDIVTGEHMAESFRKLDVPDFVFSGAVSPQNKDKGVMNGFIVKNRNGRDGMILPMRVEKSTSTFEVISKEEYASIIKTPEQEEDDLKRHLKNKMRKDFKDF